MPEILDRTAANILVQFEDGTVDSYPLSPMNKLVFDHNLWGLLKEGDEVVPFTGDPSILIVADEDATGYTLWKRGDEDPIRLGPDLKPRLVSTLLDVFRGDPEHPADPLVKLFDELRRTRVRPDVIAELAGLPPFSYYQNDTTMTVTTDGWLFRGELLLTWEAKFRHPKRTSYRRRGSNTSVVDPEAANSAYSLRCGQIDSEDIPEVTIGDVETQLSEREMEFISKALWAANVPQ